MASPSGFTAGDVPLEVSDAGRPTSTGLRLGQQQQRLVEILAEQDSAASSIYIGALSVFADSTNPDRLALAAHGLRELINLMPRYFDALPVEQPGRLGDKVRALHDAWKAEARRASSLDAPPTPKFTKKLRDFFEWWENHQPSQNDATAYLLRVLDPSSRPLPSPIQDLRVAEWRTIRDYFVRRAHHDETTEDEFNDWLNAFERFVLQLVRPRTFENMDRLDMLIAEGEGA